MNNALLDDDQNHPPLIAAIGAEEIAGLEKMRLHLRKQHGVSLSPDDPILALHFLLKEFEQGWVDRSNDMLDQQRARSEAMLEKSNEVLNQSIANLLNARQEDLKQSFAYQILTTSHNFLNETKGLISTIKRYRLFCSVLIAVQFLLLLSTYFILK